MCLFFYTKIMANNPNVISNQLDQVAKKWELYRQELLKGNLSSQIKEAFDSELDFPLWENDFIIHWDSDESTINWFFENNKSLPMYQITQILKEKGVVSCELFRKKSKSGGWIGDTLPPVSFWDFPLLPVLTEEDLPINGYDITYITFIKDTTKSKPSVKILLQQVRFPSEWAMLPKYVVFQDEIKGEDVDLLKDIPIWSVIEE